MLDILVDNTETGDQVKETFIVYLKYDKKAAKPKKKIKINKPWDVWVRINKKKGRLPYSLGKYTAKNDTGKINLFTEEEFERTRKNFLNRIKNRAELKEILSWSDVELSEAYIEANERYEKRPIEVASTVSMTNQGLITINFSPQVYFPSYMLRRAEEYIES